MPPVHTFTGGLMIYGGKITMYILNEEAKDLLSTVKEFCEGTNQVQRMVISRAVMGKF